MKRKIEIFGGGCPLCIQTATAIKDATKSCGCELIERTCEGDECCEEAKKYGIKAVPTIVIDGKIAHVGKISSDEFKKILREIA